MVGNGTSNRLALLGIHNMCGVAHYPEQILYKLFGVNAEYLIDHACGREPVEISDIKAYKPKVNSILIHRYYLKIIIKDAYLIMKEMVETNVLSLTEKHLVTKHISLFIGYSKNVISLPKEAVRLLLQLTHINFY